MIEMIVTSSTLILATFLLRRLTNGKISMRLRYALWLAAALRLWRLVLAVLAGVAGLFGVVMGTAFLVGHLAGLESFGAAYLTPFASNPGDQVKGQVLGQPLREDKLRPAHLNTGNKRKQR